MNKRIFMFLFLGLLFITLSSASCNDKKNEEADNQNTELNQDDVVNSDNTDIVDNNVDNKDKIQSPDDGTVHKMTSEEFKENIFDYMTNSEWNYKGSLPCVVDFYADWCGPFKMVAPIMEELAKEYKGKVVFYKINVDNETEVANTFGIQSIPSILFIPMTGEPQMSVGALDKAGYVNAMNQILFGQ